MGCRGPKREVAALKAIKGQSQKWHTITSAIIFGQRTGLKQSESRSVVSDSSGVGSRSLLQGIFPTQRSNPGLPHCKQIIYQLNHQGSPDDLIQPQIGLRSSPRMHIASHMGMIKMDLITKIKRKIIALMFKIIYTKYMIM